MYNLRKLGGRAPPLQLKAYKMHKTVNALHPTHEKRAEETSPMKPPNDTPLFTTEEMQTTAKTFNPNKAPGAVGIPAEALKIITERRLNVLLDSSIN